jgi:hypothetical protein
MNVEGRFVMGHVEPSGVCFDQPFLTVPPTLTLPRKVGGDGAVAGVSACVIFRPAPSPLRGEGWGGGDRLFDGIHRQLAFMLAVLAVAFGLGTPPAHAYSYEDAGAEPLLDGREALFAAVSQGDWPGAQKAVAAMAEDLGYLDSHEAPGIAKAFAEAIAAKDAAKVKAAFVQAASAEIARRIAGAQEQLKDYQTAKALVIKAQHFYTAVAADLAPDASKSVDDALKRALDALGNPGVFGVGVRPPDPAAFAAARADIDKAVGMPANPG